jgi:hypothetical protein
MHNKYKAFADFIKKQGEGEGAAPPPNEDPTGGSIASSNSSNSHGSGGSSNSIAEMQKSIHECMTTINQYGSAQGNDSMSKQTKSFHDFVMNFYVAPNPKSGQKHDDNQAINNFNPNDHKQNIRSLQDFNSSLKYIGSPGNEVNPDGSWGPRTNNALKNIWVYLEAMNGVTKDLKISSKSVTDISNAISVIEKNILQTNPKDMNPKQSEMSKANGNAENINKVMPDVIGYLKSVYDDVIGNEQLSKWINDDSAMFLPGKEDKFSLSKDDKETIDGLDDQTKFLTLTQPFADAKGQQIRTINLQTLTDLQSFNTYFETSLGYNRNDSANKTKVLTDIYKSLEAYQPKQESKPVETKPTAKPQPNKLQTTNTII